MSPENGQTRAKVLAGFALKELGAQLRVFGLDLLSVV
jgi:hypothetical protein